MVTLKIYTLPMAFSSLVTNQTLNLLDDKVLDAMRPWKEFIDIRGTAVFGKTLVNLSKKYCDAQECNLGNFVCDAMVHAVSFENL